MTGDDIKGEDRRLVFGLRNSSDKSTAASACMGNSMMVCDNMCFSSDVKLARRHTVNILRDLDGMLAKAISRIVSSWHDMGHRIEAYKGSEISLERASNLVVDLAESKALPERDVYKTVKEFRDPRHPEFRDNTLWSLYNSVTENLKGGDLAKLPERTMKMQSHVYSHVCNDDTPNFREKSQIQAVHSLSRWLGLPSLPSAQRTVHSVQNGGSYTTLYTVAFGTTFTRLTHLH